MVMDNRALQRRTAAVEASVQGPDGATEGARDIAERPFPIPGGIGARVAGVH